MRFLVFWVLAFIPNFVLADAQHVGFHLGLADCMAAVTVQSEPKFSMAAEVEGDLDQGFVAWYRDDAGKPIYATRFGVEGAVRICSGPAPMGPFVDEYTRNDKNAVEAKLAELGMKQLNVPVEGAYYADCEAKTPALFMVVQADNSQRVGFKFIASPDVAASCKKFGNGK